MTKEDNAMRQLALVLVLLGGVGMVAAGPAQGGRRGRTELEMRIDELKPAELARRLIPWQTCLLSATRQAREQKRPVLIWAFGGDPVEGRC